MSVGGGGKPPITFGINPTIAFYSIVLGGVCAVAAYTEKYRRDETDIDDRLKERYFTNMKEQQAKTPLITQTIRGQDARLDDAMNKWVWGGKADLSGSTMAAASGGGNTNGSKAIVPVKSSNDEDEPSSSSSEDDELDSSSSSSDSSDSDSGSSSSSSMTEEELEQEKKLSKKERRQRRKERKQRREARRKKREEEKRRLEAERQKLVYQSVAAGVALGAVAVGVSILVGNRRN